MEDRSSRRLRTLVTHWPVRGLSANENARALISMMARSTNRSKSEAGYIDARPQSPQIDETSCDARPDHTFGSRAALPTVRSAGPELPQFRKRTDEACHSGSRPQAAVCAAAEGATILSSRARDRRSLGFRLFVHTKKWCRFS